MLLHITRMLWNRLTFRLTGHKPRLGTSGCARISGRELEGGYYYLTSPDLPGFRATLSPDQLNDLSSLTQAIQPALNAYLKSYLRAQKINKDGQLTAQIYDARLPRHGRSMNLVADFCLP
jgi:hypothetical protein